MDIFLPIVIFIVLFILFSICGWCCRRKTQGQIFSSPVIITSTTHEPADVAQQSSYQSNQAAYPTSQVGYPPQTGYPSYPPAQPGYPPMQPYPPQQYPAQPPYPINPQAMPQPMQVPQTGMPTYTMPAPNALPPPYSEVVRQEAYSKQSPFNPNY